MLFPVRHVSVSIDRPFSEVYTFISNPENMSKWAAGLSQSPLHKQGENWVTDSPMGKVTIRFAEQNSFGIADHDVTLPSGDIVYNPLRVIKNAQGSEVVFSLFRLPGVSDKDFEKDGSMVEKDLQKLKSILEN